MNASANLRKSYIRTSALVPIPPVAPKLGDSTIKRRTGGSHGIEVDDIKRQRIVQTLDYLEYRTRCAIEREDCLPSPLKEYPLENSTVEVQGSRSSQVKRMLTIYPYKDMNWVVTMLFVVGSVVFVINAALGLAPFLDPSLAFPTLATVALPSTILIGATMFMSGGILGVFAAFNADRGTLEKSDIKSIEGGANIIYRPALIGSQAWVWIPSAVDAAAVLRTVPFQAGLMQLSGGLILSIAAVAGIPGLLDPNNLFMTQALVFMPQVIGGSMFFIANFALMVYAQDSWCKPKFGSAEWQGALWNAVGSSGFAVTGLLLLQNDMFVASIISFAGSSAFLIGSIIQWYVLMEFHATPWAT
ncbi:integral membrane protein [Colletotrichum incanum]|uniref:Integral membrane protein n=1 Tax=Colletotrichum incanum TaxID=1573173 RepID=A0A161Y6J9_COLIC|nr:integral membrane protein [Colletotrichum incanum]